MIVASKSTLISIGRLIEQFAILFDKAKRDFWIVDVSTVGVPAIFPFVLIEYSDRMKKLLADPNGFYKPKKRPSGHDISDKFGRDNGGAIPSNLLQISNTESNSQYVRGCLAVNAKQHPARFPTKLPEFFIRFLTQETDLVVDFFAGSNTTGFVAERERRQWLAFEQSIEYVAASVFRFCQETNSDSELKTIHESILAGKTINLKPEVFITPADSNQQAVEYPEPVQALQGRLLLDRDNLIEQKTGAENVEKQ